MISHKHEVLFVHIPKCGGQSIESLFLNDLKYGWKERAVLGLGPNRSELIGPPRLAHLLYKDYLSKGFIGKRQLENYFSFGIIRDPLDRVVSMYNYLQFSFFESLKSRAQILKILRGSPFLNMSFNTFINNWLPTQFGYQNDTSHAHRNMYWFVRPQSDFIMSESNMKPLTILRFDEINAIQRRLIGDYSLNSTIVHANVSKAKKFSRANLTEKHISAIKNLYHDDFILYGK